MHHRAWDLLMKNPWEGMPNTLRMLLRTPVLGISSSHSRRCRQREEKWLQEDKKLSGKCQFPLDVYLPRSAYNKSKGDLEGNHDQIHFNGNPERIPERSVGEQSVIGGGVSNAHLTENFPGV